MSNKSLTAYLRTTTRAISFVRHGNGFSFEVFQASVTLMLNEQELAWAREWLTDCQWNDVEEADILDFDAYTIIRGLARNFDGGIAAFLASCY